MKRECLYDVGVAGIHRLLANRDKVGSILVVIVCAGMEDALPMRGRRTGGSAGDCGANQYRLRRGIQRPGGSDWNDELVRIERERGEHRQWIRCGIRSLPDQPPLIRPSTFGLSDREPLFPSETVDRYFQRI